MYRETPPPAPLSEVVSCLWWSHHDGPKRIVPDGCLDLIVGDGAVFVAGPDTRGWESESTSTLHGIRFRPGRAPGVLGVAADELRDQRVELADLWGRHGVLTAERLLTEPAALAGFVGENLRSTPDPEVAELVRRLETGVPRVSAAIGDLAVSERQLRRRFTQAIGYGPATFLRVARLQRAIARAGSTTLASLAADAGYADQAHLSRDCRELTGVTPGEFFTRPVAAPRGSA
ncbi:helix-turn-helix domain-containing protein [Amycolatopsis sp.]|uniref:AraC family transcriptional regulator n=1 Tax=Amycolatopsis sp. TaxID=37632 RepID=UPI002E0ADD34|nr:helix-turn-helix domain-containing protein [Amycolatopsis sp.]